MKMNVLFPIVLLAIIAILGSTLGYQIVRRKAEMAAKVEEIKQAKEQTYQMVFRGCDQVIINLNVQAYHDLNHGNVDGLKQRLINLLAEESHDYTARFGAERSTNFAPILAEANQIADTSTNGINASK